MTAADELYLLTGLARTWYQHATIIEQMPARLRAEMWTSWACWEQRNAAVRNAVGHSSVSQALKAVHDVPAVWPKVWLRLWDAIGITDELMNSALKWLESNTESSNWGSV